MSSLTPNVQNSPEPKFFFKKIDNQGLEGIPLAKVNFIRRFVSWVLGLRVNDVKTGTTYVLKRSDFEAFVKKNRIQGTSNRSKITNMLELVKMYKEQQAQAGPGQSNR